jgi:hypothetical protein
LIAEPGNATITALKKRGVRKGQISEIRKEKRGKGNRGWTQINTNILKARG